MTGQAERYRDEGYLALPGFVPTDVTHVLLGMMKGDLTRGGVSFDRLKRKHALLANEAVEIYGRHYLPLSTFLWGMTPAVSALVGTALKPSYCYFRMYRQGDVCHVHSDRYACEHSLSLLLAASDGKPWPLEVGSQPHRERRRRMTSGLRPIGSSASIGPPRRLVPASSSPWWSRTMPSRSPRPAAR